MRCPQLLDRGLHRHLGLVLQLGGGQRDQDEAERGSRLDRINDHREIIAHF